MERSESTVSLLKNDYLDHTEEGDDVGFSSGYDSSNDTSDTEVADSSDDTYTISRDRSDSVGVTEVMNYQATGTLCHQLKYILSMPELCDVTFLVGPNKVPVHGVKAILGTRSRVLYQLILKQQRQSQEDKKSPKKPKSVPKLSKVIIDVNKYDPEDFRRIIHFIHCGTIDVSASTVAGLLCGARQFGLDDLKIACWNFVRITVTSHSASVALIMKKARRYSNHKEGSRLLRKINEYLECPSTDSEGERSIAKTAKKSTTV